MLMATLSELENAGGLSGFGAQKQISLRLGVAPIHQSYETLLSLATLGIFAAVSLLKPDSAAQSLAATVDALIGTNEEQFLASLTDDDYERLVESLDKLINVVGENENHLLAPLVDFIGKLIEKYKEEPDMTESRLPGRGLRSAYNADEPEYTPAQLDLINSQYQNPAQGTAALQMTGERPPGRGLRSAYNADEPEYTPAQLDLINSQYQNPAQDR